MKTEKDDIVNDSTNDSAGSDTEDTVGWYGPQVPKLRVLEPEDEAEPGVAEISMPIDGSPLDNSLPSPLIPSLPSPLIPRPPLHVTFAHQGVSPNLLESLEKFAVNGGMVAVWHITNPETRDFRVDWHRHHQDVDYVDREVRVFAAMVREELDKAARRRDAETAEAAETGEKKDGV